MKVHTLTKPTLTHLSHYVEMCLVLQLQRGPYKMLQNFTTYDIIL